MEKNCRFNEYVNCSTRKCGKCDKCGWNPKVAAKRVEKWEMKRREEVKKDK